VKRIHIYKIKEKLFFGPTHSVGKIYSKMVLPILESSIDLCNSELARTFNEAFEQSTIGEAPISGSDAFKRLLELTKLRSQKNLVKSAECLIVTFDEGFYTLTRVGGNERHKAFIDDLGIKPIELRDSISDDRIGNSIKVLFGYSETTT